jgi:hypothetical protein
MAHDHFSRQSGLYARYRPGYPDAVFRWLAEMAPGHELAWDSATGNGQAAIGLAAHFTEVIATDLSARQLSRARPHPSIRYEIAPSECAPIDDDSTDLILTAQALHWLDLPAFYGEVERVGNDGAVLAALSYGLLRIAPEIDSLIDQLYGQVLGDFWPPERVHVENAYEDLPFPFPAIPAPVFDMRDHWDLDHLLGYLGSWSATALYRERTGEDPLAAIEQPLREAWGPAGNKRRVRWSLHVKAGRVGA